MGAKQFYPIQSLLRNLFVFFRTSLRLQLLMHALDARAIKETNRDRQDQAHMT